MKNKIKVANVGQKIIDLYGYIYTVEEVYEKYVSIGNGEYMMHQDYKILPDDPVLQKNVIEFIEKGQVLIDNYGLEFADLITSGFYGRFYYFETGQEHPRHLCSFEEYVEYESDSKYEYDYGDIKIAADPFIEKEMTV